MTDTYFFICDNCHEETPEYELCKHAEHNTCVDCCEVLENE